MDLNHTVLLQGNGCNSKKWHSVQRRENGQILNPTLWIMEGWGPRGQQRFMIGFEPVELRSEYMRNPTIMIEEIQVEELIPHAEAITMQHGHLQTHRFTKWWNGREIGVSTFPR